MVAAAKGIHPSSVVDRHAEIADGVEIGPFCHVHAGARIGAGTRLMSHVVVMGNATIGEANVIYPFVVIGGDAQIRKASARQQAAGVGNQAESRASSAESRERGRVEIGSHNTFRESVTVNVSSGESGQATTIGSHNLFMAGCHVAHDVSVGSRCVIANGVQLAGHVAIEDWVVFGGLAGVAQHLRVGESAFIAAGAMCERDVPPFVIAQGDRARVRAINAVGLERRGVPPESILALRKAYAALWTANEAGFDHALRTIDRTDPWVAKLAGWLEDPIRRVRASKRAQPIA